MFVYLDHVNVYVDHVYVFMDTTLCLTFLRDE